MGERHRFAPSCAPAIALAALALGAVAQAADATAADANPTAATSSAEQIARDHFRRGQIQYNLAHFDQAAEEYSKAYEAMPLPEFLFNIGQCHKKNGDNKKAIFFFEGYLREAPQAENRALVEELIAEARAKLAEPRTSREQPRRDPAKSGSSDGNTRAGSATGRSPAQRRTPSAASAASESAETAGPPFYRTWWFWTAAGCATLAVATVPLAVVWLAIPESRPILSFGLVSAK